MMTAIKEFQKISTVRMKKVSDAGPKLQAEMGSSDCDTHRQCYSRGIERRVVSLLHLCAVCLAEL
jgi:hypothetical protein